MNVLKTVWQNVYTDETEMRKLVKKLYLENKLDIFMYDGYQKLSDNEKIIFDEQVEQLENQIEQSKTEIKEKIIYDLFIKDIINWLTDEPTNNFIYAELIEKVKQLNNKYTTSYGTKTIFNHLVDKGIIKVTHIEFDYIG